MDNYEDGWLEQAYEDRFFYEDDGYDYDVCPFCDEHFMDCFCDEEEELHDRD